MSKKTNLEKHAWYTNVVIWERGSGKTYYFVRMAREAYEKWYTIVSNVWLAFPHIRYRTTKELVPILEEIAEYNYFEVTPMEAPPNYLKAYNIVKKEWTAKKFFILIDELGIHFNHRNWSKNFSSDFLKDMIFEPRKYWMTIVGIAQEEDTVDVEFLRMCNHWFTVKKYRSFWFDFTETVEINWYYVRGWTLRNADMVRPFYREKFRHYYEKKYDLSKYSWWLYYTREMQWVGVKFQVYTPNLFQKWDIYSPFSLTNTVPETPSADSAKPAGSKSTGGQGDAPPGGFTTRKIRKTRKKPPAK